MDKSNIDRYSQAEKAAHWLTETLEDLNHQASSYGNMVRSLEEAKNGLNSLQTITEKAINNLQQQMLALDNLKSGEFMDRISILSENLARAQIVYDNAFNRITAFTSDYSTTHQAMMETSQNFVEEGKKLYSEVKNLADSLPRESGIALNQWQEKWSQDITSLDSTFQTAIESYSQLFRSFEEKLLSTHSLLDRLIPLGRSVADEFTENLEKAISDINRRLNTDRENLLTGHKEDNRNLLDGLTNEMKTSGENLINQLAETSQKSYQEWETLFSFRTEDFKTSFLTVQSALLQLEKTIHEQSEQTGQREDTLRNSIAETIETINQCHQTLSGTLENLPPTLKNITEQNLSEFKDHLQTVLKETEHDWLVEINTTKDQQIQELTTTKKDLLDAISGTVKGIGTNRGLLVLSIILSAVATILAVIK